MKEQLDKLSKKIKFDLNKRIIKDDRKKQDELTKDELMMIEQFIYIAAYDTVYSIPTCVRISTRYHLDFIYWVRGIDVLLCDNSKKWIK